MARAYLGLGSNMGDRRALIARAIGRLAARSEIEVVARSGDYLTPPWGDVDQPPFVNACVAVETSLSPLDLLAACLDVERALGRDRSAQDGRRYGPRLIDVDLLAYEGVEVASEELTLPHPRLGVRAFVLLPLAEIAPDLMVDTAGRAMPARHALLRLDASGITALGAAESLG